MRGQAQRLIQELLQEEVTEFLGRAKSARRSESDSATGYRNGYANPRRLTLSSGTIQLRRPRVRDSEEGREPAAAAVRPQDREGCCADPRSVPA